MQKWDYNVDIVVIGSGGGGLTAALAAQDSGCSTLVLEKSPFYGGATAMSGGAIWVPCNTHMKNLNIPDSKEEALEYLASVTEGIICKERLQAYVDNAATMVDFLEKNTPVKFDAVEKYPDYYPEKKGGKPGGRTLEPQPFNGKLLKSELAGMRKPHPQELAMGKVAFTAQEAHEILFSGAKGQLLAAKTILHSFLRIPQWVHYGRDTRLTLGNALIGRLRYALLEKKIPIWCSTPLHEIIMENDKVVGVQVLKDGKLVTIEGKKGVILASGGFARKKGMRVQHQMSPISTSWTAAPEPDQGEVHQMGESLGADMALMDENWWTPTTLIPGEELAWLLVIEKSLPGSIMVNKDGKRFTNEASSYNDVVKGMYGDNEKTGTTIPAFIIMDKRCRENYPCGPLFPGKFQPELFWKKALKDRWIEKGSSVEQIAEKLGIDAGGLKATIQEFNTQAVLGKDPAFHRGESAYDRYYADPTVTPNPSLAPLKEFPFYGFQVWPGDLGTKGGMVTDKHGRVLKEDGSPIPQLYATGNCTSSVMGRSYPGAGGTIGPSMTFGYLAARFAAQAG